MNLKSKMVKKFQKGRLVYVVAIVALIILSCKKNQDNESGNLNRSTSGGFSNPTQNIPVNAYGVIQDNFDGDNADNVINLTNNKVWLIDGVSYVPNGKTLKIQAGTILSSGVLKAYAAAEGGVTIYREIRGVLVVVKGAKINAVGTEASPIVFTSDKAPGSRIAGDFGGLVLLGNAPINQPTFIEIEGLPIPPPGIDITYGGSSVADNSGILQYIRIEYPGFKLFGDNGVNGLTLGGVGSGTTLEHIQVTYSSMDGFGFFGGTVNGKWLVSAGEEDDGFSFKNGYTGSIQYAVGLKAVLSWHSTSGGVSDANGIESDNDRPGDGLLPRTKPTLRNLTLLGTNANNSLLRMGNRWRRNTGFDIQNSIVAGFPAGVAYEGGASGVFANNILHAFSTTGSETPNSIAANGNSYLRLGNGTTASFYISDASPFNANFLIPHVSSPAAGVGGTYAGAIAPGTASGTTWLKGWTEFTPQNKIY